MSGGRPDRTSRWTDRRRVQAEQDRQEIFQEALREALNASEIAGALRDRSADGTLTEDDLRRTAETHRRRLLDHPSVKRAEREYRRAFRRSPLEGVRFWHVLLRWSVVAAVAGVIVAACVMRGWAVALRGPVGSYRDVPVFSRPVLLNGIETFLLVGAAGVAAFGIVWGATRLLRGVRRGAAPGAQGEAPGALVSAAVAVAVLTTFFLTTGTQAVVQHF